MMNIVIYTDGACANAGPHKGIGGWAAILVAFDRYGVPLQEKEVSGSQLDTTNNVMELMAVVEGLKALRRPSKVTVVTDSEYVKKGITEWIHGWMQNGWRTSSRKPVKNKGLWLELYNRSKEHLLTWEWVRGHNGHEYNERADTLAVRAKLDAMELYHA